MKISKVEQKENENKSEKYACKFHEAQSRKNIGRSEKLSCIPCKSIVFFYFLFLSFIEMVIRKDDFILWMKRCHV